MKRAYLVILVILNVVLAVTEGFAADISSRTGDLLEKQVKAVFDPLPPAWVAESNVMDDIWKPLGLRGVNFYAFGARVAPHTFAARSDPGSPLYQAWIGVYVVAGGREIFAENRSEGFRTALKLTDLDQRSWLDSMGDPHPGFTLKATHTHGTILVDGVRHPLFTFDATTHSDLTSGTTPLATHMGMPPTTSWKDKLAPFHALQLRGYYTYWYDPRRDLTVVVYAAAAGFEDELGKRRDNFPALDSQFLRMMRNVRLRSLAPGIQPVGAANRWPAYSFTFSMINARSFQATLGSASGDSSRSR